MLCSHPNSSEYFKPCQADIMPPLVSRLTALLMLALCTKLTLACRSNPTACWSGDQQRR